MLGDLSQLMHYRYRLLLAALLLSIFLQPVVGDSTFGQGTLILAYATILFGGIYATGPQPWLLRTCGALAALLVVLSWHNLGAGAHEIDLALIVVTIFFGIIVTSRTLSMLAAAPEQDSEALASAVFGYFFIALNWALFFRALEILLPGSFTTSTGELAFTDLLYFSIVTITTLGYGDITPINSFARISVGLEAAMGTLYIAILIARIVGALRPRSD